MTLKQYVLKQMTDNGMFDKDAEEVFRRVEDDGSNAAMYGRWGDDTDGYPASIRVLARMSAWHFALEWIDENCPLAWYRPMFVTEKTPETTAV